MTRDRRHLPLPALDVEACMGEALRLAEQAGAAGEFPVGAVVVLDGVVVGRGRARRRERRSQLAHAELEALLDAGEAILTRHDDAVLLTTVEPCPLCLGATVMADVPHLLFGAHDRQAGMGRAIEAVPYLRHHLATYRGGVLERESRALIARLDPALLGYLDAS